jgi:hypothetical protein
MEAKPLRLAGDTNLLLDLADSDEDVLDAVAVVDQRMPDAEWLISPSVLDELAFLTDSGDTSELRQSARAAFQQLESGDLRPTSNAAAGAVCEEEFAWAMRPSVIIRLPKKLSTPDNPGPIDRFSTLLQFAPPYFRLKINFPIGAFCE